MFLPKKHGENFLNSGTNYFFGVGKMSPGKLVQIVDWFFENPVKEIVIKFSEPMVLNKEEYKELVSGYDSSNSAGDSLVIDEFVYDEDEKTLVKLFVEYENKEDIVLIHEISIYRERR